MSFVHNNKEFGFGRRFAPDPRDYPARVLAAAPLRKHTWRMGPVLDQGATPQCTVYSTATAIMGTPYKHSDLLKRVVLSKLYLRAQQIDEWPGEDYDGTSVRAACKAWKELGFIAEYRWATSTEEIAALVANVGPVVVGTDWTNDMFTPDAENVIHPTGKVVGGHAYCFYMVDPYKSRFGIQNTWGARDFGVNGRAYIDFAEFDGLMKNGGEAAVLLDISYKEFNKEHPKL